MQSMKPTLVVLAAGMGSRYGGLKQLDRVGPSGETIIDYSIFDALRAGFEKIVFIIRPDIESDFRAFFDHKLQGKAGVSYVHQETGMVPDGVQIHPERVKPWGTGHAVLTAAKVIDGPFAVINADDFYGFNAYQLVFDHLSKAEGKGQHCMVGYCLGNTLSDHGFVSRGICSVSPGGLLEQVVETTKIGRKGELIVSQQEDGAEKKHQAEDIVSMNFWGFTADYLLHLEKQFDAFIRAHGNELKSEFYIPSVVASLIQQQEAEVKVYTSADRWFGVTYKEDKPVVEQKLQDMVARNIYPKSLW